MRLRRRERPRRTVTLRIEPCSPRLATWAVERWHYSKRMPTPPHVCYSVTENERLVGVVVYSRGSSNHLGRPYGLAPTQVCELTRVAFRGHVTPISQVVRRTLRDLRDSSPGLRLVVSFADPQFGHHGGIYQAMGWIYTGSTASSRTYVSADGTRHHERTVSRTGSKMYYGKRRRVPTPSSFPTVVITPGKHRYLWPLDKGMRRRISPLAQPYPPPYDGERGLGGSGATTPSRGVEAGSIPVDRSG